MSFGPWLVTARKERKRRSMGMSLPHAPLSHKFNWQFLKKEEFLNFPPLMVTVPAFANAKTLASTSQFSIVITASGALFCTAVPPDVSVVV